MLVHYIGDLNCFQRQCSVFVQHPLVAAGSGIVYILGRVLCFRGYASGTPGKRFPGFPIAVSGLVTLLLTCGKSALSLEFQKK